MKSTPLLGFTPMSQIPPQIPNSLRSSLLLLPLNPARSLKTPPIPNSLQIYSRRASIPKPEPAAAAASASELSSREQDDGGIPADLVKILVKFKSRHHYIRVLQVSRKADHPFAGSRLLLLDAPGNIHSLSFLFTSLTHTYFDVFATLPPLLPPGPIGIFGFGAGSAARLILELYPKGAIHGWELDPAVISVAREYFGLSKLEKSYPDRLFVYIGNALQASVKDGFSGILVDLFCDGCLIPELQDPNTWVKLKRELRRGGRIMVNVGGSCVEAEDSWKDGKLLMEETLKAMNQVFPRKVSVLSLGNGKDDSSIALTGDLPEINAWRESLPESLQFYAEMWKPCFGSIKGKVGRGGYPGCGSEIH